MKKKMLNTTKIKNRKKQNSDIIKITQKIEYN